jgi:hypothetical protein
MAVAITYRTSTSRSALRTVLVEDVRRTVVLLPTGRLDVVTAKLLQGTCSRHDWWAQVLGTDPASTDFVVGADQVVAERPIQIAVKVIKRKA